MTLIGREKEKNILRSCLESDKSEFVVIYGRRRVGKTFLVKEYFENKFAFYSTGILNGSRDAQLRAWNNEILRYGCKNASDADSWVNAFENLNALLEQSGANGNIEKKIVFLDEVPWMATMHSDFLAGLDYFWNRWATGRRST